MTDLTFFTNEEGHTLAERFKKILKSNTQYFDVLVGYFRASGFYEIYEAMENIDKIRILVGIDIDKQTANLLGVANSDGRIHLSNKDVKDSIKGTIKEEMETSEDKSEVEKGVRKFIEFIQNGKLEMRIYPEEKIHAKVYIMRKDPNMADDFGKVVTGSSNFSYSGLKGNLEFNVELKNSGDVRYALNKFEKLWAKGVNITNEYVEIVTKETWLKEDVTPYQLYLKFLYEYFYDEINEDKIKFKGDMLPEGFSKFQYQIDAVNQAKKIIHKYNGVFLADVVGLGKTYIAALLSKQLKGGRKLFICPPVLVDYWEKVLTDFGISGTKVISLGKLDDIREKYDDEYFQYIFIDEAHRFRNSGTTVYGILHEICLNKKIVLISATPQNNYSTDLLNLIALFQQRNNSNIIEEEPDIENFFNKLKTKEKKAENLHKDMQTPTTKEKLDKIIKENSEQIRDKVLRKVMVRRVRGEIRKYYQDDMDKQGLKFPELETPQQIVYQFDVEMDLIFDNILHLITEINYSRYKTLTYLIAPDPTLKSLLTGQLNMKGFMKALLLKRLESSFYAFSNTVRRFKESYEKFLDMYNDGTVYISKKYNVYDLLNNENDEKLMSLVEEDEVSKFDSNEFNEQFKIDLESDLAILKTLYDQINKITVDPKVEYFIKELKNNEILKESKKIIFTESQETAEYLKDKLHKELKIPVISFSGSSSATLKDKIRANFDPNNKIQENDYNLLITTDVLAEGINLHRANVLINYDLPWNPTRIMQRIGRINRVGTTFDKIFVFNFFPTSKSNEHLSLKDNISSKLQAFHNTLGDDFKYLSEEEETKSFEFSGGQMYETLTKKIDSDDDWEDSELEYLKEIREIRDKNEELFMQIKELPKKSRSGKKSDDSQKRSVISFIKDGELKRTYITNSVEKTKELEFFKAVKILKCTPEEKRIAIPEEFYELLQCNKYYFKEFKSKGIVADVQHKKAGSDANFKKIVKVLESVKTFSGAEEDKLKKIKELSEAGILPKDIVKKLVNETNEITKIDQNPHKILANIYETIPQTYKETEKKKIKTTTGSVEVILSEYLI